jgi:hypothetical protein
MGIALANARRAVIVDRSEYVTTRSRTQLHRTGRHSGRVAGPLLGALLLPYALPIGIVVWMLGSGIALAALAVLVLTAVAMVLIAGVVATAGAVAIPATAVYLLTIGFLGTATILTAQRALAWFQSIRTRIAAGHARRGERVARRAVPSELFANRLGTSLGVRQTALATSG